MLLKENAYSKNLWIFLSISFLLLGLHAFLSFYPEKIIYGRYSWLNRSWGFNHVKFYGWPMISLFYTILMLSFVPFIRNNILYGIERLAERVILTGKKKYILFVSTGMVSALLFYAFRNTYFLLGDFTLRVAQTMKHEFLSTEYLTMRILYHLAVFLSRFNVSSIQTFVYVSCAAGGFFVTMFALIADQLGKTRTQKIFLFAGGTASGMLMIFCGYIDIYALPVAFASLYLYMSIRYIGDKRFGWAALATLALAIGSHLLCVAFAPALFIAWYQHHHHRLPFIQRMSITRRVLLVLLLVLLTVIAAYQLKVGFMLPAKAVPRQPKYPTLWSSRHLWEFLNAQLLGCGISLLVLPLLLYKAARNKPVLSPQIWFFMVAAGGMLLVTFLANLQRGSGDWDISSLTAIATNMLVILLLLKFREANYAFASYILLPLIVYNGLQMCLWIHINSGQKSLAKVESMLINDPGTYYATKLPGIIQLVYIYKDNKLIRDAERISLKACDCLPGDIRGCILYADMLANEKRENEMQAFYEKLLQRNAYVPNAYIFLMYTYQNKHENQKLIPTAMAFYHAFKGKPDLFLTYLGPENCFDPIEFLYQHIRLNSPETNLREMESDLQRLKKMMKPN